MTTRPQTSSGDLTADRRFNYAQALLADGDAAGAADLLRQTLELTPAWVPAWMALSEAEQRTSNREAAETAMAEAARLDHSGVFGATLHLARLRTGQSPRTMPEAYVAALFDDYAPRFDRHLLDSLGYSAPAALMAALDAIAPGRRFGRALDLGCGTGLMGAAIGAWVDRLDGVDLSPAMVERARATGHYTALAVDDVTRHLRQQSPGSLDLVLAADVLVYIGALDDLLRETRRALGSGGLFAFTLQSTAEEPFRLGEDLRFSYGRDYLGGALDEAGLVPMHFESVSTRRERGSPVPGLVVVARRP